MEIVCRIKHLYERWNKIPVSTRHAEIKLDYNLEKYFKYSPMENDFPFAMAELFNDEGKEALNVYGYTLDLSDVETKFILVAAQLNFAMFYLCEQDFTQVESIIQIIDAMMREKFTENFLHGFINLI